MGRKRTGTVLVTRDGRYQPQVTIAVVDPNGKRRHKRKRLPPFPKGTSKAYARERTAYLQERADAMAAKGSSEAERPAAGEEGAPLPCDAWVDVWLARRRAAKLTSVRENESHWRVHIRPIVGHKHVADWAPDDLRLLVAMLDRKASKGEISTKTATNVWTTCRAMCGDALSSKDDELKCRENNPAADVRGPDASAAPDGQFLYPSEAEQFFACDAVPMVWRELAAVAVYTYLRAGELRPLRWEDVDLEHGVISVVRALDRTTGGEKTLKGKRRRHVPIHEALAPLLRARKERFGGEGRVFPDMPSKRTMARSLRRWLARADVDRAELHAPTPSTKPIVFHDLRATGLTWLAVERVPLKTIQRRAGHASADTTDKYIRLAESLGSGFGEPFPALPLALLDPVSHARTAREGLSNRNLAGWTGLEPAASGVTGRRYNQLNYHPW